MSFWACTLVVGIAEGGIGWWLRALPLDGIRLRLAVWLAALLALLAGRVGASWIRDRIQERVALEAGDRLVRWVWSHPSLGFERGAWLSRSGREIAENGSRARSVLVSSSASLAILLPLLVWFSPALSLALLVLVPGLAWISRRRWRAARGWLSRERELLESHSTDDEWAWRSAPEAFASGTHPRLARLRRTASSRLREERGHGAASLVDGQAQTEAAAHLAGWTLAGLALLGWSEGLLPATDLLAFLASALLAYRPIREAGRAVPAFQRLRELLRSCSAPEAPAAARDRGARLTLRDLRVDAPDGTILVEGPGLDAAPGSTILVSGANGSGKSSLLSGVAGLRVARGIVERPPRIRYLAQEPVLPPYSPREWSGHERAEDLPLAARLFPSGLPCAWDSPVAKGGSELSRGERARLALLCQTARPADLWILDEPFSALPHDERSGILEAIRAEQGQAILLLAEPSASESAETTWAPPVGRAGPRVQRL